MNRLLIIYDNEGIILNISGGSPEPKEPSGVPFMWVDIPKGKRMKGLGEIGINTHVKPHEIIFEDILPDELTQVKEDSVFIAETLALALEEIETLKVEISAIKGE